MIYPLADKLEEWGSKYALVTLAAKRAKQIRGGASPLIPTSSRNSLTVALEEIASGRITSVVADTDEPKKSLTEPEVAQLLALRQKTGEEEAPQLPVDETDLTALDEFEEEEEEEEIEEESPIVWSDLDDSEVEETGEEDNGEMDNIEDINEPASNKSKDDEDIDIDISDSELDEENTEEEESWEE